MKFNTTNSPLRQIKADAAVIFLPEDKKLFGTEIKKLHKLFGKRIDNAIELGHFTGKTGECLLFLTERKLASPRLFLVGTGESKKHSPETYRRAAATAAKKARSAKAKHLAFAIPPPPDQVPSTLTRSQCAQAILEGAELSLYCYDKYFTDKKEHKDKIAELTLCDLDEQLSKELKTILRVVRITNDATFLPAIWRMRPAMNFIPRLLRQPRVPRPNAMATGVKFGTKRRSNRWDLADSLR